MTCRALITVVTALALSTTLLNGQSPEGGTRLKDVASLQGVSATPVIGYGLVVGLNKTGDKRQTIFSTQTLANMLQQFGVAVPPAQMKVENITAAMFSTFIWAGGTATPNCCSMFASVCVEKIVCRLSPVLFNPTTSPYPITGVALTPCNDATSFSRVPPSGDCPCRRAVAIATILDTATSVRRIIIRKPCSARERASPASGCL